MVETKSWLLLLPEAEKTFMLCVYGANFYEKSICQKTEENSGAYWKQKNFRIGGKYLTIFDGCDEPSCKGTWYQLTVINKNSPLK